MHTISKTYTSSTLSFLVHKYKNRRENETTEFKQSFNGYKRNSESYKRTICAFLNNKGGTLVYGLTDSGFVKGMRYSRKDEDHIRLYFDSVGVSFTPFLIEPIHIETYFINRDLAVIEVTVPKKIREEPYVFKSNVYWRGLASNLKMNAELYVKLSKNYDNPFIHRLSSSNSDSSSSYSNESFNSYEYENIIDTVAQVKDLEIDVLEKMLKMERKTNNEKLKNTSCCSFLSCIL